MRLLKIGLLLGSLLASLVAVPAHADPVTLNIGGIIKTPDFAGAAPGAVGLTLVKMTITDDLPTATTVNLVVTVNTKPSTMLMLPLQ